MTRSPNPRVKLAKLLRPIESGVSVNGIDRPAFANERGVLKVSAVTGGYFAADENKAVVDKREESRLSCSPLAGDILMTRSNGSLGLVGKCVLVDRDRPNLYLSDKLWRLVVRDPSRDDAKWLFYLLSSERVRRAVIGRSSGSSGMRNISKTEFLDISVRRPPLSEQVKISAALSAWDRALSVLSALIREREVLKKGLMQQLLTGKRRFPQFVQAEERHATLLGDVPVDWIVVRLKKLFRPVTRRNDDGVSHVLTASGRHGLVDQMEYFNRSVAGKSLDGYFHLKRGEFAYNRSLMKGYPYGAIKRLDLYDEGVISTLYLCFELVSDKCNSDFFMHLFEAGLLNRQLRRIAQMGARAHGLLNVTATDFFKMYVPVPSREEQDRIAAVLNGADQEINLLEQERDAVQRQKKGLMQQLLNGQVRVPAAEVPVEVTR